MSKTDNKLDNKPDPRACPKCHKFPCSCPSSGSGSDDENKEKEINSAEGLIKSSNIHLDTSIGIVQLTEKTEIVPEEAFGRPAWCSMFTMPADKSEIHISTNQVNTEDDRPSIGMSMGMGGSEE